MSTNLGFAGGLLASSTGKVLSFGGTVTPPVLLPTPAAPLITAENDAAQTLTFSIPGGLGVDQVRYEVAGAGPFTPTSFTIQLSPTTSYLPGAVVLYVVAVDGVRNESARVANQTTLAATVPPSNVTPPAPGLACDDTANTLTVSSGYPLADLELRLTDTGAVGPLPGLVTQVGDVVRPEGYYQVRVKAASGRNPSAWARSLAYTQAAVTPPAATWTVREAEGAGWTRTGNFGYDDSPNLYRNNAGWYMAAGAVMSRTETCQSVALYAPSTGTLSTIFLTVKSTGGAVLASGSFDEGGPLLRSGGPNGTTPQVLLDLGVTGTYLIEVSCGGTVVFDAVEIR